MKCPDISPWVYIATAAGLLLLPIRILVSGVFAAAFHELCHLCALYVFHIPVAGISVGIGGAKIRVSEMENVHEMLVAAAGPAGSLLLCLFHRLVPTVALFGLVHGLFNLIPVYPLDGGRMLRSILEITVPQFAPQIEQLVSVFTLGYILWFSVKNLSVSLSLIMTIVLVFCFGKEKLLAKRSGNRYNSA